MRLDQQRKIMQIYLNNYLEELKAREAYAERGEARGYDIATKLKLLDSVLKGTEKLDRPGMAGLMRAPELGMDFGLPEISPEQYGEAIRPYTETMADQAGALEAGKYLPAEKMGVATQLLGSERAMDLLKEIGKTRAGREAREVTREKTKLGWAELAAKKKGEIPDKELKKTLDKLINRRDKARLDPLEEEEANKLTKQINALYKKLGKKSEKDYEDLAEELRAKGYTIEKIKETPGMVKDLEKQDFEIWILAGYL